MKKIIGLIAILLILILIAIVAKPGQPNSEDIANINDIVNENNENVEEVQDPIVDQDFIIYQLQNNSKISWLAKKTGGQHNGYVYIQKGELQIKDGVIVGGYFIMDMTSLKAMGIDNKTLEDALKGEEYFNVENFPSSQFTISRVTSTTVKGDLELNGITKTIEFPATVTISEDMIQAQASTNLDRTSRGINGGIPAVSKYMELTFDLTWTKK